MLNRKCFHLAFYDLASQSGLFTNNDSTKDPLMRECCDSEPAPITWITLVPLMGSQRPALLDAPGQGALQESLCGIRPRMPDRLMELFSLPPGCPDPRVQTQIPPLYPLCPVDGIMSPLSLFSYLNLAEREKNQLKSK